MHDRRTVLVCIAAACAACAEDPGPPPDPCEPRPVIPGGAAELGLGNTFAPVIEGQEVELVLGSQGLWMFLVTARVRDMDIDTGDRRGLIEAVAVDQASAPVSLEAGCRAREFVASTADQLELASPYFLPLLPDFEGRLEGAMLTIRLEVRDSEGRRASDQRTVVARFPGRVSGPRTAP